jgi:hypothetical protein
MHIVPRCRSPNPCPPQQQVRTFTIYIFFSLVISNQSTGYSMSWCAGWLTIVVRSPPARGFLSWIQSFVDWFVAPRKWGFNLKTKSTNYPVHGHHGDPPPTRKIPMVEPGIEPGTSWLVVRSSDHQTTRLGYYIKNQQDATLAVLFISHCKITVHVSDASCVHHQEC